MISDWASQHRLLRPREAAALLAISERTLWDLSNRGDLPTVRLGRSVRYDPGDLATWVARNKSAAAHSGKTDNQ
jgi:excisionase family DNA binding protein